MRFCELCKEEPMQYLMTLPMESIPGQLTRVCRLCKEELILELIRQSRNLGVPFKILVLAR